MASFLNNPQTLGQFNPFVQTLPIDEMVKVGMYKQDLYNKGVQRLQQEIDEQAALDVIRPIDQTYLQSSVDKAVGELNKVSSSDFSNQQLVNQLGGMTASISRDSKIRGAVGATARYRAEEAFKEASKKDNKWSIQNEEDFNKQVSAWYNSDEVGKQFDGKYSPWINIDKDLLEAVGKVGIDGVDTTQIFETYKDADGIHIRRHDDGTPVISKYGTRVAEEGKAAFRVQAAINTVLMRPEIQNQLRIDGNYKYRGISSIDQVERAYLKNKNEMVVALEDKKLSLMLDIANARGPINTDQLKAEIANVEKSIEETKFNYENRLAHLKSGDIEAYKTDLYKNQMIESYTNAFSTKKTINSYVDSPAWKANMDYIKHELDVANSNWKKQMDRANLAIDREKLKLDKIKTGIDVAKWDADKDNPKGKIKLSDSPLKGGTDPSQYNPTGELINASSNASNDFSKSQRELVEQFMLTIQNAAGNSMSIQQVRDFIKEQSKSNTNFLPSWYEKAKVGITQNSTNPRYSILLPIVEKAENAEAEINLYTNVWKNAKERTERALGKDFVDLDKLNVGNRTFSITGPKGEMKITPSIIKDLAIYNSSRFFSSEESKKIVEDADKRIKNATGLSALELTGITSPLTKNTSLGGDALELAKKIQEVSSTISSSKGRKSLEIMNVEISKMININEPLLYKPYRNGLKAEEKKDAVDNLKKLVTKYLPTNLTEEFSNSYSGKDNERFDVSFVVQRGTSANPEQKIRMQITDSKEVIQSIEVNKEDMEYVRGITDIPTPPSLVQRAIQASGELRTTNAKYGPYDKNAPSTAMYRNKDFYSRVKDYDVAADVVVLENGNSAIYLYVKDAKDGNAQQKPYPFKLKGERLPVAFSSPDEAAKALQDLSISDALIKQVIKAND